jgi:heavy metal sensor kinase
MIDSVRSRLTLWYVSVLAAVLALFSLGVYGLLARLLQERLDEGLLAVLDVAATSLAHDEAEGQDPADAARSTVTELSMRQERLAIYDSKARLLARGARGKEIDLPLRPGALADGETAVRTVAEADDDDDDDHDQHRVAVRPVRVQPRGTRYLIVASQSLEPVQEALETMREVLYWAVPVTALAAGLVGWFLARKSLAPVVVMAERARRMGAASLGGALPVANPRDELGRLALAFNELLARLDAAFGQQRQFMADASHELRTPLSAVQAAADVTLQRPHRDEDEYREALALVADQARRLTRIVEEMFTLARADAGHLPLRRAPLYLDETLADVVRAARVLAEPRGVAVELATPGESPLVGDEDLLRRLVLNLVDNAIRHSPSGAVVRLGLERTADGYRVTVSDQGPGIPEEARERVFERFFRLDTARGREEDGSAGSGAGLGLSIARWIAEAHGGRLDLVRSDAQGSLFAATLPLAPRA